MPPLLLKSSALASDYVPPSRLPHRFSSCAYLGVWSRNVCPCELVAAEEGIRDCRFVRVCSFSKAKRNPTSATPMERCCPWLALQHLQPVRSLGMLIPLHESVREMVYSLLGAVPVGQRGKCENWTLECCFDARACLS